MKAIAELKKDMDFNRSLRSLVEILKSIAVAHYHMLERKIKAESRFYEVLKEFFAFPYFRRVRHPFLTGSDAPAGIVAITSDMGLLGGLNAKVMAAAFEEAQKGAYRLVVIGEKGHAMARDRGFSFIGFPGVKDEERFGQALSIRDFLMEQLMAGKMGSCVVFYPEPVSFLIQRIKKLTLVPFEIPAGEPPAAPAGGRDAGVIVESDLGAMIEYLFYLWTGQAFFELLGFSRLAELSARYLHLEGSSQKIKDLEAKIRLQYFRVRHELIDKSMREIFSARAMYVH